MQRYQPQYLTDQWEQDSNAQPEILLYLRLLLYSAKGVDAAIE